MAPQRFAGLFALLALSHVALAQITTPCTYQEYVCGSTLLANGYEATDLLAAYEINPDAPEILEDAVDQVLFRCIDQGGTVIGNSFCIVGCATIGGDTVNDMCTM